MFTATQLVMPSVTRLRKNTFMVSGMSPENFTATAISAKLIPDTTIQAIARGMLSWLEGLSGAIKTEFPFWDQRFMLIVQLPGKLRCKVYPRSDRVKETESSHAQPTAGPTHDPGPPRR